MPRTADGRDLPHATFVCPDLGSFGRLDELGLQGMCGARTPAGPAAELSRAAKGAGRHRVSAPDHRPGLRGDHRPDADPGRYRSSGCWIWSRADRSRCSGPGPASRTRPGATAPRWLPWTGSPGLTTGTSKELPDTVAVMDPVPRGAPRRRCSGPLPPPRPAGHLRASRPQGQLALCRAAYPAHRIGPTQLPELGSCLQQAR